MMSTVLGAQGVPACGRASTASPARDPALLVNGGSWLPIAALAAVNPCAINARTSEGPESYVEGRNHSRLFTTLPSRIQASSDNSKPPSKPEPTAPQPSGTGPNTES